MGAAPFRLDGWPCRVGRVASPGGQVWDFGPFVRHVSVTALRHVSVFTDMELASGRVWKRVAVERWIRKHPVRRPGRRPAQT
jgi:hypothetical protein